MEKEELVLDVKTNIGKTTKETKDWAKELEEVNEQIVIQDKVLIDLEKELLKLKKTQDSIPKGAYYAGMSDLNKKIAKTTAEIKSEKLGLKDLKNQQKEATTETKKFNKAQKETNKQAEDSIGNFKVMGVSLNSVRAAMVKVGTTAKAMFATIKAGMISTGIGALIVAVGSLAQAFTRSEEGQDRFRRIMAGIGAVTSQLLDTLANLGETIIKTFTNPVETLKSFGEDIKTFIQNPIKTSIKFFKDAGKAVKDFITQTKSEIDAMDEITKARQKAYKIERQLKKDRANADRDINDIRLEAEDREKNNATERIKLLREAQKIEEDITNKEIRAKRILIQAQKDEMALGKNQKEDKDTLAQLQAELIKLDTKKLRSQRLLQTQITTATNEEKALKEQKIKDFEAMENQLADELARENAKLNQQILDDAEAVAKSQRLIDEKTAAAKINTLQMTSDIAMKIAGEGSAVGKAVAVAMAIMNTKEAITAALGAKPYGPWNIAQAVATGAFGMMQVRDILSTPTPGNESGGGSISAGSISTAEATPPAPQMMGGTFELGGGIKPEPVQAYVVSDDITNNQDKLAAIRRRATI
jgi:hypothetical protein